MVDSIVRVKAGTPIRCRGACSLFSRPPFSLGHLSSLGIDPRQK
jgi:hypothetical protein